MAGEAKSDTRQRLLLVDDCVAERDWAERLWDEVASGRADLAGGARVSGRAGVAARLEYLSTDGPVLSPRLPAGPARRPASDYVR